MISLEKKSWKQTPYDKKMGFWSRWYWKACFIMEKEPKLSANAATLKARIELDKEIDADAKQLRLV